MALDRWVALLLGLGILPSIGPSFSPELSKWGLAFHPLKWGIPFFLGHLWMERHRIPRSLRRWLALFFGVGTLSFAISVLGACKETLLPSVREWAVWTFATLACVSFFLLKPSLRRVVASTWMVCLILGLVIDVLFPGALNFLYENVLDPQTRMRDYEDTGSVWTLTGIWGRQSLAKLLSWIPFLWAIEFLDRDWIQGKVWRLMGVIFTALLVSFLVIGTTQRGPLFGTLGGVAVIALFAGSSRSRKTALIAIPAFLAIMLLLTPRELWLPRIQGLLPSTLEGSSSVATAYSSLGFRRAMWDLSLKSIASHPLGQPCIPLSEYLSYGLPSPGHAHHLFLHPFRDRGWAFGFLHLSLWVFSGVLLLRRKSSDLKHWVALGAWTSVIIGGMTDYPWFVLHQAFPLSLILWRPFFEDR